MQGNNAICLRFAEDAEERSGAAPADAQTVGLSGVVRVR
jgi:hypothetical protein